jgi:hypothetical protein
MGKQLWLAHRNFKGPRKARRPGRDPAATRQGGMSADVCGSKIVAAAPIRTASPLAREFVWP